MTIMSSSRLLQQKRISGLGVASRVRLEQRVSDGHSPASKVQFLSQKCRICWAKEDRLSLVSWFAKSCKENKEKGDGRKQLSDMRAHQPSMANCFSVP